MVVGLSEKIECVSREMPRARRGKTFVRKVGGQKVIIMKEKSLACRRATPRRTTRKQTNSLQKTELQPINLEDIPFTTHPLPEVPSESPELALPDSP